MSLRLGSLFSGAGGLDLAIEDVFGAELRWVSDIIARDKHGRQIGDAPRILAHRFPNVPNLGDITTIDWAGVEPVDIIAGGSPCQDVSAAGKRAGMTEGTRSNLWVAMRDAIAYLQPAYVIWENVRGALSARASSEEDSRVHELCLCGGTDRRRGVHPPGHVRPNNPGACLGGDDGASAPNPHGVVEPVGRDNLPAAPGDRAMGSGVHVARDGRESGTDHSRHSAVSHPEKAAGRARAGRGVGAASTRVASERPEAVDRCGAAGMRTDSGAHADVEREGAACECPDCGGCVDASRCALESDPRLLGDHQPGVPVLRAAGRVLGDLATLGFDAAWCVLPAAAVGAPHRRQRIFVVAAYPERVARLQWRVATPGQAPVRWPLGTTSRRGGASGLGLLPTPRASRGASDTETVDLLPTPVTTDGKSHSSGDLLPTPSAGNFNASESPGQWETRRERVKESAANGNGMGMPLGIAVQLLPTPSVADSQGGHERRGGKRGGELLLKGIAAEQQWGKYATAITRWETLTRTAPEPTIPGKNGRPQLNPEFSEWMQGWPAGWVADVPGMRDTWKHHAIGNGVVPQQASAAIRWCLSRLEALGGAR